MASRKELKKNIKYVSIELILECYLKYTFTEGITNEQISPILMEINKLNYDFITKLNHPDGKENPKITKSFYKKLIEEWNINVDKIIHDIEKLGK